MILHIFRVTGEASGRWEARRMPTRKWQAMRGMKNRAEGAAFQFTA
jgi:hypothetical protein